MRIPALVLAATALASCAKQNAPLEPDLYEPKNKQPAKEAISLRLKLQPGDVLVYEFHSKDTTTQPAPIGSGEKRSSVTVEISARMVDKVVSAENDRYEIERIFENPRFAVTATGSFEGKEKQIEELRRSSFKLKDKLILDDRYRRISDPQSPREQGLPEHPIREGDTWTTRMPNIRNQRDPAAQFNDLWPNLIHKVGKIEQLGEWKTISIEVKPEDPTVLDVEEPATIWYDIDTGVIVQARFKINAKAQRTVGQSELKLIEFHRSGNTTRSD